MIDQPAVDVRVWEIRDVRKKAGMSPERKKAVTRPYEVRWTVNKREHSRSFPSKILASDFQDKLRSASRQVQDWDFESGQPAAWVEVRSSVPTVSDCARMFVRENWDGLAPKSRKSQVESLVRLIEATADSSGLGALSNFGRRFRQEVTSYLSDEEFLLSPDIDEWLRAYSPTLTLLTKENLALADSKLRLRLDGRQASPNTYSRYRSGATQCLTFAVERGFIEGFELPVSPSGHARRKSVRRNATAKKQALRELPNKDELLAILDAHVNGQPESHRYRVMSAVAGLAGLRPGEVAVLERGDVRRTNQGDYILDVSKAWQGSGGKWGERGEDISLPKTALGREVYIPELLVGELDSWCEQAEIKSGPLFLIDGSPPSNWPRALSTACSKAGVRSVSPYELRHTNATLLMEAGVPLGVIAQQLGNSVEVLVEHYLGWLQGSRESAPIKLQALLSS